MSKWRVAYDCGEFFVSEIADEWGSFDSFDTEAEAIAELRRVQTRGLISAEEGLRIAEEKLAKKRLALASPPRVNHMTSQRHSEEP